jgi:hypothetical protein
VEIRWPSGSVEKIGLAVIDRIFTLEEGKGIASELCATCQAIKFIRVLSGTPF